jgi:glutamate N-acetyltransferase/amino-acid N-acetyltransferase
VIGQPLDAGSIVAALPGLAEQLHEGGEQEVAQAILTTDNGPKTISATVALSGGLVRLTAQAKGAGMINPSFATMFCFLQTDAKLSADTCDLLLGTTVKRSFERISVDGQLSTNDVVILIASGGSGVAVEAQSADELAFGEALDSVMRELALQIVADGEGAARVGRVVVEGGDDQTVEHVARTVAGSPLVKAALHGGDPNWGRILGAVGMAIPDSPGLPVDIEIEGVTVCSMGAVVDHDVDALAKAVNGTEVDYLVRLPGSGSACEVFFSDLSQEYVTINSEYTT